MNLPVRFRPSLEALEERSLLAVTVDYYPVPAFPNYSKGFTVFIDARPSDMHNTIHIYNDGAGHITGDINGDTTLFNGADGFFAVSDIQILGGPGGASVYYFQQADQFGQGNQLYAPVGPYLHGRGVGFSFHSAPLSSNNTFAADFEGHAVLAGQMFFDVVVSGSGTGAISFNAQGVNIRAAAALTVDAEVGNNVVPLGTGNATFAMDYSGVKGGTLQVAASGNDAQDDLRLDATFLGTQPKRPYIIPVTSRGTGVSPGDLSLSGGPGDNSMEMLLSSPGGLPLTGDVYGGSGVNRCLRTSNVHSHNCNPDELFPHFVRFNPNLARLAIGHLGF
jgi:hypothetical protein